MDYFPLIHTNIWDAVIGVPIVLCVTQLIKVFCRVPGIFVPTIALVVGNVVSIVFGHHEHVYAGIFMGFFYGYAAIGSFSPAKTSLRAYRTKHKPYS
ncbi:hypothetical protein [Bacillus amyloliquefaciens]|uniref:hypothetical protein n=1 Tax=Bacillus amyloliquefaciens TaxID=1390 RepID=UPI002E1D27CB|nr:hypothetical protein [Bacillus amyloliquefaciens]